MTAKQSESQIDANPNATIPVWFLSFLAGLVPFVLLFVFDLGGASSKLTDLQWRIKGLESKRVYEGNWVEISGSGTLPMGESQFPLFADYKWQIMDASDKDRAEGVFCATRVTGETLEVRVGDSDMHVDFESRGVAKIGEMDYPATLFYRLPQPLPQYSE